MQYVLIGTYCTESESVVDRDYTVRIRNPWTDRKLRFRRTSETMRNVFPTLRLPRPHCEEWEWQLEAACHAMPASMFFPNRETGVYDRTRREREAKRVCATCPVIEQCRRHALETHEAHGIWGGLTALERLRVLQR